MAVPEAYKKEILSIIMRYVPQVTVRLFGSRATGHERQGSDIDLALDTGKKIPLEILSQILASIDETTIPMQVDLVDLYTVADDFKKRVLKEGVVWILSTLDTKN